MCGDGTGVTFRDFRNTNDGPRVAAVMITLHVPDTDSAEARRIATRLDDLVVAYSRRTSDASMVPVDLPAIEDGGRWYAGEDLSGYFDELARYLGEWRKFQSDACYIHDDGSIC